MRNFARDELFAVCSDETTDPRYRYSFTRRRFAGGKRAVVILHNPVHRGDMLDPTTGKCMTWLCSEGNIGEVVFINLFAYRHRDPLALVALANAGTDVIGPRNDEFIESAVARSDLVIVAWGANPPRVDAKRASRVISWIEEPYCFGTNIGGSPVHPNRRGSNVSLRCQPYVGGG